jgi:hypothetical protein
MDCNSNEKQNQKNLNNLLYNRSISSNEEIQHDSQQEFSQNIEKSNHSNISNENASDEISYSVGELKNSYQVNNLPNTELDLDFHKNKHKEHHSKVKKLPCILCDEEYAKQNLLKCYICKELKCKTCAVKETHNHMKKRDNAAYICEQCYFNKNEKNR